MGLAAAAQQTHMAPPDNTLSSGTIFAKSRRKISRNDGCTIVLATGLKAPAWTLSFTPCQETKSHLTPIISLIHSTLKPKLLNMAFNLACYLCFWKTRTASFKASIAFLPAGLPTSPWEANDTPSSSVSPPYTTHCDDSLLKTAIKQRKKLYQLKYHLTDR